MAKETKNPKTVNSKPTYKGDARIISNLLGRFARRRDIAEREFIGEIVGLAMHAKQAGEIASTYLRALFLHVDGTVEEIALDPERVKILPGDALLEHDLAVGDRVGHRDTKRSGTIARILRFDSPNSDCPAVLWDDKKDDMQALPMDAEKLERIG